MSGRDNVNLTFWEHLDELRSCIMKILVATLLFGILAFLFKDEVFRIVFAPKNADFIVYGLFDKVADVMTLFGGSGQSGGAEPVDVQLINTGLTSQFVIHVKMAFYVGLLFSSPYIIYVLFRFVSPGLYTEERKYVVRLVSSGYVMFILGTALSYFVVFPLTFRFLGTYSVSEDVENLISLESYMDTFVMLNLMMGIMFELPVICWLLSRFGLISAKFMRLYRKHAIVAILIAAAIITPTSDAFTLLIVAAPIWLLYELSIFVVRK